MNTTTANLLAGSAIARKPEAETGTPTAPAGAQPVTEAAEPERKKIANREWVNDAGEVVDEEAATGVRYEFLGRTKDGITIAPDGANYSLKFSDLSPAALNMLAGFGAITLMGNVTNTWMGDKSDEKPARACDAIAERFALLQDGKWIDRSAAGVGAKVDKDVLAEAAIQVFLESGKITDAQVGDVKAKVRQKLEDDSKYGATLRQVPAIATKYATLVGRQSKTVDDVLGGLV